MKLLKATEKYEEQLKEYFETVETVKIEELTPEVINKKSDVKKHAKSVSEYDAAYFKIPQKNAIFGRVLLETIEEMGVQTNYPSTAFFIMAKKNYLYHVLHQRDIPSPKTAVIADEKAVRNIENHLRGPLIARKLKNLEEVEKTMIDEVKDIKKFSEGLEYGENLLIFSEYTKGDKYKCLYAGGDIISLKDTSEDWKFDNDSLKYSSLPSDLQETVKKTCQQIGTPIAELVIRGDKIVDIKPNPDLEMYTKLSGKDAFESVTEVLKGEVDQ